MGHRETFWPFWGLDHRRVNILCQKYNSFHILESWWGSRSTFLCFRASRACLHIIVLEAFIYMLTFYSFPLQTPTSFRGHSLTCLHCSFLVLNGISKSAWITIILDYSYGPGVIVYSVPGLEINYMITLKSSIILATLPLSSVVSYCLIVLPSLTSCHPPWGHPLPPWWQSGLRNH